MLDNFRKTEAYGFKGFSGLKSSLDKGHKNQFEGYNNNFASIALNTFWGESTKYFKDKQSSCVKLPNSLGAPTSQPIANFENLDKFLDFMISKLSANVQRITQIGLPKYYVCYWPVAGVTEEYFDSHITYDTRNSDFQQ